MAERIGRSSGLVTTATPQDADVPRPADILRFTCTSHPDQPAREATLQAGLLSDISVPDLQSVLARARPRQ